MNKPLQTNLEPLMSAAMKIFVRYGYGATTVDLIAKETGISQEELCRHFYDKDALFKALIDRVTIHRTPLLSSLESLDKQPRLALRRMAARMLAKMDDKEYLSILRIVIGESERFPHLANLYMNTIIASSNSYLSKFFASHPELKIKDPEATARIFIGALVAFDISQGVLFGNLSNPIENERLINSLVDMVLANADVK